jgi:hypothetical protein
VWGAAEALTVDQRPEQFGLVSVGNIEYIVPAFS